MIEIRKKIDWFFEPMRLGVVVVCIWLFLISLELIN